MATGTASITDLAKYINAGLPTLMNTETKPGEFYEMPLLDEMEEGIEAQGGYQYRYPLQFGQHSTAIEYVDGMEQLNFEVQDVTAVAYDSLKSFAQVAVVTFKELRELGTAPESVSLAKQRKESAELYMRRGVHQRLLGYTGTGDVSTPFLSLTTLNGWDYSTGILEAAAPGSQTHSVSNVSKATFSFAKMMSNQFADAGGDAQLNLRNAFISMSTPVRMINGNKNMLSKGRRCFWVSSEAAYNNLTRVLYPQEQYIKREDTMKAAGQFEYLNVSGLDVIPTYDMPNAGTNSTARPISMYLFDTGSLHWLTRNETGSLSTKGSGWVTPTGKQYFSWAGAFREYGNGYNILYDVIAFEGNLLAIRKNTGRLNLSRCGILLDADDWGS